MRRVYTQTGGNIYYSKRMLLFCRFLEFFFLFCIVEKYYVQSRTYSKGPPLLRRSLCVFLFSCWNALRFCPHTGYFRPHTGYYFFMGLALSIARFGFLRNGMGVRHT